MLRSKKIMGKKIFNYFYLLTQISTSYLLIITLKKIIQNELILKEILIAITIISTFQIAWQSLSNNKIPIEISNKNTIVNILKRYYFSILLISTIFYFYFNKILSTGGISTQILEKIIDKKIEIIISIIISLINFLFYSINISLKKQTINSKIVTITNLLLIFLIYFKGTELTLEVFAKYYILAQIVGLILNTILLRTYIFSKNNKEYDFPKSSIKLTYTFYFILFSRFTPIFLSNYIIKYTDNSLIEYHYLLIIINLFLTVGVNPVLNFTYSNQILNWQTKKKKIIFIFYSSLIKVIFSILFLLTIFTTILIKFDIIQINYEWLILSIITLMGISLSAVLSKLLYLKNYITLPTIIDFISTFFFILIFSKINLNLNSINLISIQYFILLFVSLVTIYLFNDLKLLFKEIIPLIFLSLSIFVLLYYCFNNIKIIAVVMVSLSFFVFRILKNKKTKLGIRLFLELHE